MTLYICDTIDRRLCRRLVCRLSCIVAWSVAAPHTSPESCMMTSVVPMRPVALHADPHRLDSCACAALCRPCPNEPVRSSIVAEHLACCLCVCVCR